MEGIKINKLELENVKKIKAVALTPSANGLTIIGGNNAQGKTSVLDAICWALGGNKYKPSNPQNDASVIPPNLNITLIGGKNGTGKTTLLKSIKIGLFGCFSYGYKTANATYFKEIKNISN